MADNISNINEPSGGGKQVLTHEQRAQAIRDHVDVLRPLEKERDKINDGIKEANLKFKAATGITKADFNAGRRWAELEQDDEKKKKMSTSIEVFNALSDGEQLDFFSPSATDEAA